MIKEEEVPKAEKIFNSKWVYTYKWNKDGSVRRFKARCVMIGCQMLAGFDYGSGTAQTIRQEHFKFLLARAARLRHAFSGVDFSNAFLHAELEKPVELKCCMFALSSVLL